jgi:rhodanese-related sulfurtransferase
MDRITREGLQALLQAGTVQLIEALPVEAYAAEHLPGARNAPAAIARSRRVDGLPSAPPG